MRRFTAMSVFTHYNIVGAFGISLERLSPLFLCVENTYCFDPAKPNTYHTHVHAADVTLTVSGIFIIICLLFHFYLFLYLLILCPFKLLDLSKPSVVTEGKAPTIQTNNSGSQRREARNKTSTRRKKRSTRRPIKLQETYWYGSQIYNENVDG